MKRPILKNLWLTFINIFLFDGYILFSVRPFQETNKSRLKFGVIILHDTFDVHAQNPTCASFRVTLYLLGRIMHQWILVELHCSFPNENNTYTWECFSMRWPNFHHWLEDNHWLCVSWLLQNIYFIVENSPGNSTINECNIQSLISSWNPFYAGMFIENLYRFSNRVQSFQIVLWSNVSEYVHYHFFSSLLRCYELMIQLYTVQHHRSIY